MTYKLIRDKRIFMNTTIEFSAWTELDRDRVYEIFNDGFKQFHLVVDKFSRFKKNSELSRLNANTGKEFKVSKEMFRLISFSLEMAKKTEGLFDPTIIDFLEAYGYGTNYDFQKLKNKKKIQKEIRQILKTRPSYKDTQLSSKDLTVKLAKNQRIDLGAIGKGYAIDKAYEKLKPLKNYIINAGGDIRAGGKDKTGKPWLVQLKIPKRNTADSKLPTSPPRLQANRRLRRTGLLGTYLNKSNKINLHNQALCSSGSSARKVKFFHHLIDPTSGKPKNEVEAVFVQAETAMKADAWATALFVAGEKAERLCDENEISAVIVKNDTLKLEKFNWK